MNLEDPHRVWVQQVEKLISSKRQLQQTGASNMLFHFFSQVIERDFKHELEPTRRRLKRLTQTAVELAPTLSGSTRDRAAAVLGKVLPLDESVIDSITQTILEAATSPWLQQHPPRITWPGWQGKPWLQDPEHPFVAHAVAAIGAERGTPPELAADTAGLDARFAGEFGIPCVVFGPDGENLHGIDEWVSLSSVRTVARSMVRLIATWVG